MQLNQHWHEKCISPKRYKPLLLHLLIGGTLRLVVTEHVINVDLYQ